MTVQLNVEITHQDITIDFLKADFEDNRNLLLKFGKVLLLKKAIYGLKQSSRSWYREVDDCLIVMCYKRYKIESGLYTKDINYKTIVTLYVDDFFIF